MDTIGQRISIIQKMLGLSTAEFAERLGLSKQSYYLLTVNRTSPKFEAIQVIFGLFPDLSVNWFLFGKGEPRANNDKAVELLKKIAVDIKSVLEN